MKVLVWKEPSVHKDHILCMRRSPNLRSKISKKTRLIHEYIYIQKMPHYVCTSLVDNFYVCVSEPCFLPPGIKQRQNALVPVYKVFYLEPPVTTKSKIQFGSDRERGESHIWRFNDYVSFTEKVVASKMRREVHKMLSYDKWNKWISFIFINRFAVQRIWRFIVK